MREVVAEVGYYADAGRPMRAVVRSVGVLAILFGAVGLVTMPFEVAYRFKVAPLPAAQRTVFYTVNERLSFAISTVSSVIVIVGGIGCLRRRPRGRGLLRAWGWGMLGWLAYVCVLNGLYLVASVGRYPLETVVVVLGQQMRMWIGWMCLPAVVVALFGQRAVREVFEEE